ncbi:MAG TPA: ATP-dependent zinc metalloprotease FtsH [Deltaproteobacteria bacterium]|nr:ATP-dependent zinc metalloprotease FtsH [Deltaproteobacteria bacterium]
MSNGNNGDPEDDGRDLGRWWLPIAGLLFLGLLLLVTQLALTKNAQSTSWTELKQMVAEGKIEDVVFDGDAVRARRVGEEPPNVIHVVRVDDDSFLELLEANDVPYRAVQPNPCAQGSVSLLLIPLLLMSLFWVLVTRQGGPTRGMAAFGRSSASMAPEEGTGVTFADVAGVEEAAEELQEVIAFLKTPEKFTSLGGRPPKGVLLVGPPGTGKTLLARAVAGEAGVPFFSISGSAFVEMFVGVGAARVRDLFKNAVEHAPCIIFIDELDAVGKARGVAGPAGNEEREQTLNQLLVEMDGFDNRKGIIVMAATNRPEILDPALLRAGRFDRQVVVDRPDVRGREAILSVHAKKLKLGEGVDLEEIAKLTPGFAGADLANALNEAALLAARRDHEAIMGDDIEDAIERVIAGLEKKNRRLSEREKRTVAYHECGHAVCAAASPGADPVKKISIIPRGIAALGYTIQMPLEDRYLMSKAELLNRITILYGGRAAEEIVFGDVTTGAHDDIRKATDLARRMVTEYGMSTTIGAVDYSRETGNNPFGMGPGATFAMEASPDTAEAIEREVHAFLSQCHQRARDILLANVGVLEEMSATLLEREVLDGSQMRDFLAKVEQAAALAEPPSGSLVTLRAE